jgi:hexokinase
MISGKYLGDIVRRILVSLARDSLIFNGTSYDCLLQPYIFETEYISNIEESPEGDFTNCEYIFKELGVKFITQDDCAKIR